jgi:glycosyltransferase involved in cell wall biosynthesis
MALPLLQELRPRAVIYDCMDELSAFKGAPRQMKQRETALLKRAQLVLTGGPALYQLKRSLHDNVLCVPSAVDSSHYDPTRARGDENAMGRAEALQGSIAAPRLGFFGVIDERFDVALVAALADAEPLWHFVMLGPVVKIDAASLPRRPNLHWLGQQPYELLPQIVAGWSVCLMPFAMNESTRFISPTKTLEYMAAGKPIVSTPIHDVEILFGDIVAIAADANSFAAACRDALSESAPRRAKREAAMQVRVAEYSWDRTAETIAGAIDAVLGGPSRDDDSMPKPSAVEPPRAAAG